jgi:hypothetical protein
LLAQEPNKDIKEGHSHNGHAFNEGPRQEGPLMESTGNVHLAITSSWDKGQAYFNQGLGATSWILVLRGREIFPGDFGA